MSKHEIKIGETFQYESVTLKCIREEKCSCEGCFFFDHHDCREVNNITGSCSELDREDGQDVIFIQV